MRPLCARISLPSVCVRFTAIFLIYLISFIFHFLTFGGNFLPFFGEISQKKATQSEQLLCSISGVCFKTKNVRNQRIGTAGKKMRERKKDIKLKVVKTSSRFSIYFQLHFALLLGAFRKCFFFFLRKSPTTKQC
jgi:hypothetical protein